MSLCNKTHATDCMSLVVKARVTCLSDRSFTYLLSLGPQAPCAPPLRQLPPQTTRAGPTQARPPRCPPRRTAPPTPTTPTTWPGSAPSGRTSSTPAAGRWPTTGPTPATSRRRAGGSGRGQQARSRGGRTRRALGGPRECDAPPLTQT